MKAEGVWKDALCRTHSDFVSSWLRFAAASGLDAPIAWCSGLPPPSYSSNSKFGGAAGTYCVGDAFLQTVWQHSACLRSSYNEGTTLATQRLYQSVSHLIFSVSVGSVVTECLWLLHDSCMPPHSTT